MVPTRPDDPRGSTPAARHVFFQTRQQPAGAPTGPPQPQTPPRRRPTATRVILPVAAGAFAMLLVVGGVRVINPPAKPLSPTDVAKIVDKALKGRKPEPSIASVAFEKVRPSLVLVKATRAGTKGKGPEFALGTGVVVEEQTGLILTALHVVRGATQVQVMFNADGSETPATVVTRQPENDLAVLKPDVIPDDLIAATLAGSGQLHVGDQVVAVGNPFGIVNSVTAGVVSGLGRSFQEPQSGETLKNLIQFDAAVNPGNSGGPLLDRNGEVVGIVSALLNPTDQEFFVGIGFAVTIETAAGALGLPPW